MKLRHVEMTLLIGIWSCLFIVIGSASVATAVWLINLATGTCP